MIWGGKRGFREGKDAEGDVRLIRAVTRRREKREKGSCYSLTSKFKLCKSTKRKEEKNHERKKKGKNPFYLNQNRGRGGRKGERWQGGIQNTTERKKRIETIRDHIREKKRTRVFSSTTMRNRKPAPPGSQGVLDDNE